MDIVNLILWRRRGPAATVLARAPDPRGSGAGGRWPGRGCFVPPGHDRALAAMWTLATQSPKCCSPALTRAVSSCCTAWSSMSPSKSRRRSAWKLASDPDPNTWELVNRWPCPLCPEALSESCTYPREIESVIGHPLIQPGNPALPVHAKSVVVLSYIRSSEVLHVVGKAR